MNFIGHFLLGHYTNDLLDGNYIADDVNGSGFKNYDKSISNCIFIEQLIHILM